MPIQLFNTASRSIEPFVPLDPSGKQVSMYTCGPTVYNYAHIGNFRAYLFEDLLQRHLEARDFSVNRVMNLTDVDDKTIRGCRQMGVRLAEFTARYKTAFFEDLETLRIRRANSYPAATEPRFIERMIQMIQHLESDGIAYLADDGSVYFRIARFANYGKLAHLNLEELRPSGRISNDEYEKESVGDFALWKAWNEEDGDVFWESPWGKGRPGWHIECSAMATALLGPQIDIHCGGVDNIFPHHEAEIAQSECVTGKQFVKHWLHCAHLLADNQKMSKSLGNFYTLRDLLERGFSGREIRFALITVHYRLPLNFTLAGLEAARAALARLDAWQQRLQQLAASHPPAPILDATQSCELFLSALDDDLNISAAMGHLFDWLRDSNRAMDAAQLTPNQAAQTLLELRKVQSVLALEPDAIECPPEVKSLLSERDNARKSRDWKRSDELRDAIIALGWTVKDTKEGQQLVKL